MVLSIRSVLDVTGGKDTFAGEIDLGWIKRHKETIFPEKLYVSGEVENRAGVVTLKCRVRGTMPFKCDRCLAQKEKVIDEEFSHTVVRSLSNEEPDDDFLISQDGILIIDDIIGSDLQLALPQVILCKEDCRGLCPICGADLNYNDCGCQSDSTDPRLQDLKNLLKD
jgi:uncharacterized protein